MPVVVLWVEDEFAHRLVDDDVAVRIHHLLEAGGDVRLKIVLRAQPEAALTRVRDQVREPDPLVLLVVLHCEVVRHRGPQVRVERGSAGGRLPAGGRGGEL
jgi:hypothetical protein